MSNKKREQIEEKKKKKQMNQNTLFQNVEGEHKEKATFVSDLIKGLTCMNRFLISMFPSLLIFLVVLSI